MVNLVQFRAPPSCSNAQIHISYFSNIANEVKSSSNVFKLQMCQGMFSPLCTAKFNTTHFVKRWKTLTHDENSASINETMNKNCRGGLLEEGVESLKDKDRVNAYTYVFLLQGCANAGALAEGKQIHANVLKWGYEGNINVNNKLILMYGNCGSLEAAYQVFDKMPQRSSASWVLIIRGYARARYWEEVLELCNRLQYEGIRPDNAVVPTVLKACGNLGVLEEGKEVHGYVVRNGFEMDAFVQNSLVGMYMKCGCLEYARQLFDKMPHRDVITWTAIIGGYAMVGCIEEALKLLNEMDLAGVKGDVITWNAMITGFIQNGQVGEAFKLLCQMEFSGLKPDLNTWNAMITGCAQNGNVEKALDLFWQMQLEDIKPNSVTIAGILSACADLGDLWTGIQIHGYVSNSGFESNVVVGSALVDMYSKCNLVGDARKVFDSITEKNVILFNAMIAGYAYNGHTNKALELFHQMSSTGMKPNLITWNAIIAGYAKKGQACRALEFFFQMHQAGIISNATSWNFLIAGFVQNGHGEEALKIFHEMQSGGITSKLDLWNALITRCSQDGYNDEAFKQSSKLIIGMKMTCMKPNSVTIVSVLSACASLMALQKGKEIHGYTLRYGLECNVVVGSSLVEMYAKCKRIKAARKVFDVLSGKNVVSWNVMIAGYAQNGDSDNALEVFRQMQAAGLKPDSVTILIVLSESSNLLVLQDGKQIHGYITRNALDCDVFITSALIDMYAKCASIADARHVFDQTDQRDVGIWNGMIAGYVMHGLGEQALAVFHQMQQSGTKPDHITFTAILSACSHSCMVSEGWQYFKSMTPNYGLKPSIEHYTCMVNLLGSVGHLEKAYQLINIMPFKPDACIWGTLLSACRRHDNIELGEYAAKQLFELEPENVDNYILLSNMYARVGRWDEVGKVRSMMNSRGLKIRKGCSWIKVNNRVHRFIIGDISHPEVEEIYAKLTDLFLQMEEEGFMPEFPFTEQDVDKEYIFCGHTEKLAVAFGLINISSWMPIGVVKNLRMCVDCHATIKIISRITGRDIHVRDTGCIHYFKDGFCSCRDSW